MGAFPRFVMDTLPADGHIRERGNSSDVIQLNVTGVALDLAILARLRGPLSQGHGHHPHAAPIPRMLSHKEDGSTWVFVGGARMCKRTADSILYNFPGFFETNDESATLNN